MSPTPQSGRSPEPPDSGTAGRPRQYFPGETPGDSAGAPGERWDDPWAAQQAGPGRPGQAGQRFDQAGQYGQYGQSGGYQDSGVTGRYDQFGPYAGHPQQGGYGSPAQWNRNGYGQAAAVGAPANSGRGSGPIIALGILVGLLVIALAGVLAWSFFGGHNDSQSTDPAAIGGGEQTTARSASTAPQTSSPATTSAQGSRPADAGLPGTATPVNEAARDGEPAGNFNSVHASGPTSEPFALAVRDAFVGAYKENGRTDQTVEVFSPVTGTTYTMTCRDTGSYVHCTGGNDANVYIS